MKKIWKRAGALLLAAAMCLGLAGCGDKSGGENNKTLAQELGYGYLSEYSNLDIPSLDYINSVSSSQGKLYLCGDYYDDATYESGTKLYEQDLETGTLREIPLPELVNTDSSHEYIMQLSVCPDGSGFWIVTNRYTYVSYDWEEDVTGGSMEAAAVGSDQAGAEIADEEAPAEEIPADEIAEPDILPAEDEYAAPTEQYFVRKCDMSGNVVAEIDMTEITSEMSYFYCQALAQDGSGDLYLASDETILCFGSDGSRKQDVSVGSMYVQSMVASETGGVLVSGFDYENGGLGMWRIENGALTPMTVEGLSAYGNCYLYPGAGNTVLMSDGTLLYSVDSTTGQTTKLLSWLDSDINGNNIAGVAANGEDKVLVLLNIYQRNGGGMRYELGTLTKTPVEEIPERTILTLGAVYLDDTIQDAVIRFNRNSDTYRITLMDYSVYNTEDDYEAGVKQMDKDVVAGSGPDILSIQSLGSGNVSKYISKGALADLSSLMAKDDTVSMDDLLSGPMSAYMRDGKLYAMPCSFGLSTLYASAKLVGDRNAWTMAEMGDVIRGLDEDVQIMMWYTQADFLTAMIYQNMDQFVDYGKATCNFNTDEFKSLLEVAARLPADYESFNSGDGMDMAYGGDEMQMLQTGDLLMASGYGGSGSYEIKMMTRLYTRENGIVRIGYPVESGNGALLNIYSGLAVSSKSKAQEGAWEFIKTMLSDEVQENQWSLPVTNKAFDKVLQEAMEKDYYTDENGEKVYVESTGYIGNTEYQIGEVTQAEADAFRDYVNNATVAGSYDSDILEIITEEAAAYFAGDKTADQVADLIQNRVSIYLGETS